MTTKTMASLLYGSVISAGLALLPASIAIAAEEEGALQVSAQVIAVCAVTSEPLEFGFYSADSNTDAFATINVYCTTETHGTISLGLGLNDNEGQRQMTFTGNVLAYDLYSDSARNNAFAAKPVDGIPGAGSDLLVYGRIPQGQTTAPVGEYTDTVQITFAY